MRSAELTPPIPPPSVAVTFIEHLRRQDFPGLRESVTDDVHLRALLPSGVRESAGVEDLTAAFGWWFRDVTAYEVVDATVGAVGPRVHLRWRVRVVGGRFGRTWHVVEQQAYADTADDGRIRELALVCSGFQPGGTSRRSAS